MSLWELAWSGYYFELAQPAFCMNPSTSTSGFLFKRPMSIQHQRNMPKPRKSKKTEEVVLVSLHPCYKRHDQQGLREEKAESVPEGSQGPGHMQEPGGRS